MARRRKKDGLGYLVEACIGIVGVLVMSYFGVNAIMKQSGSVPVSPGQYAQSVVSQAVPRVATSTAPRTESSGPSETPRIPATSTIRPAETPEPSPKTNQPTTLLYSKPPAKSKTVSFTGGWFSNGMSLYVNPSNTFSYKPPGGKLLSGTWKQIGPTQIQLAARGWQQNGTLTVEPRTNTVYVRAPLNGQMQLFKVSRMPN